MKRSRFFEEKIASILKGLEAGAKAAELVRKYGVSDVTIYIYGLLPACRT
jgi:putative transposase